MATLPSASVSIDAEAGANAGGTGYLVVIAPVGTNADSTPRVFSSARSLLSQHNYAPGVSFASTFIEATRLPVLFVGVPVATAGVVGRQDASGVTGSSVISIAAGSSGYLEEVDAILTVVDDGTIGTDLITFLLSLDGGVTEKLIRLGTASSYTVPYVGIVISFAAGDLNAGDEYTFTTTAPTWDSDGIVGARTALAAQQKLARSWMVIGDVPTDTVAGAVVTAANAYATSNERFTLAAVNVRDRLPLAEMSRTTVRMSGTPTLTFLEVGVGSDTITRSAGSFVADGFAVGDVITVAGSVSNNVTAKVTGVSALVLTLGNAAGDDLANEGPVTNCTIVGSNSLVFTTTTATRSGGSWLNDGFAVGDSVTFDGTSSNEITVTITVLTATVMTFASGGSAETIGTRSVTCTKGETMAAWVSSMDAEFAPIDGEPRIDIGIGRGRKACPITGWNFRRPAAWHSIIRQYQHDVHIPPWRKEDGPLSGVSLEDADGNIVEFDERTDGGALAGRFTCLRTWGNGPNGAFIAMALTRATEGSLLSRTHNMAVANVACTTVQAETENAIGQVLILNKNGTGSEASLALIEGRVNSALQIALLQDKGEGPRASSAVWKASRTDVLNVVGAELTGTLDLRLNGTLEQISTRVRIQTSG